MAYEKQQWQDEILNEPNVHFDVIDENGNVIYHRVRITRQSTAAQEGTKVTAELMNHIEDGINDVHVNLVNNAGAHNSIYRGASLGTSVSAAQFAAIGANTFNDLWLGDYWTIGGVVWRIAGFNYYWNVGDTNCATPHITIVPDMILYNAQMNTTNIVTGAYVGSAMYTANLAQAKTAINAAFGAAHILNHRVLLANAVSENAVTGWAWYDSTVELLTEYQVYGARAWGAPANNGHGVASQDGRLPGFALRHDLIHNRQNWWLQDVVSATDFAFVSSDGSAYYGGASYSGGVRPYFSIIG